MNLVETYLVELVKTEPFNEWDDEPWAKDKEFIEVTAIWNCYGRVEERTDIFEINEWSMIKEKGYYLG